MYPRILIPLDGSRVAEQVLPYARFLARALAIPVHLLKVIDLDEIDRITNPSEGRYFDTLLSHVTASSRIDLQTIARSFQVAQVACLVEEGKPAEVLIQKAAADKDTLIVMATHGRSGIQRWLLGSVANRVLQDAVNHVFLVRATEQGKTEGEATLKAVIVPLDGSHLAEQVLPHIEGLAKRMGLEIILLQVYAQSSAITPQQYAPSTDELFHQFKCEVQDYLAAKVQELKEKGLTNVKPMVKFGYAADEIMGMAGDTDNSFVAMCTHGRSGISRWVMGSVTNRVVRHSRVPVLVIRATALV